MGRDGQSRTALRVLAGLLLLLSLADFGVSAWRSRSRGFVDLPIFLTQAERFLETGELYRDPGDPDAYAPAAAVYKFPPLFAISLLPLVVDGADFGDLVVHWYGQIALYLIAVALLVVTTGRCREPAVPVLALVVALNFVPFFETLWRLQVETPILLLLVVALLCHRNGRDGLAGACVGIGAALKLYPAFLLLYFLAQRRWAALGGAALAGALAGIASLVIVGPEQNWIYLSRVLPVLGGEAAQLTPENVAPARYLRQALGLGPDLAKRIGQLAGLALAGLSVWRLSRRADANDRDAATLALASFLPAMLIAMPNSWVNYQLLLLPAIVLTGARLLRGPFSSRDAALWAALGGAWLLTLFYQPCAPPTVDWPCAETPWFLGAFHWPRDVHDALVDLRGAAPFLVWWAAWLALGRGQPRGLEASR